MRTTAWGSQLGGKKAVMVQNSSNVSDLVHLEPHVRLEVLAHRLREMRAAAVQLAHGHGRRAKGSAAMQCPSAPSPGARLGVLLLPLAAQLLGQCDQRCHWEPGLAPCSR